MSGSKQDPHNLAVIVCYSSATHIVLERTQPRYKEVLPVPMLVVERKSKEIVSILIISDICG